MNKKEREILGFIYRSIENQSFSDLTKNFKKRNIRNLFRKDLLIHRLERNGKSIVGLTGKGFENLTDKEVK